MQIRTEKKASIWLALTVAIGLHAIILLLPITRQLPPAENERAHIELQLTSFTPQPRDTGTATGNNHPGTHT